MIRRQKRLIFVFCEGDAEVNLFGFLKLHYSNKNNSFKEVNMGGFRSFAEFEKKYSKRMKGLSLQYGKDYSMMRFCFLFDNDLEDSEKIVSFLKKEGHMVQLCDPNIEGLLLSFCGEQVRENTKNELFRKKIKDDFENYFCCEAHEVKEGKLNELITEGVVKNSFPILYGIFRE